MTVEELFQQLSEISGEERRKLKVRCMVDVWNDRVFQTHFTNDVDFGINLKRNRETSNNWYLFVEVNKPEELKND